MLGGRSDHTNQNYNTKVVDDGISMMHLNEKGDLVGEDTNRAARIVLSFTHSLVSDHLSSVCWSACRFDSCILENCE